MGTPHVTRFPGVQFVTLHRRGNGEVVGQPADPNGLLDDACRELPFNFRRDDASQPHALLVHEDPHRRLRPGRLIPEELMTVDAPCERDPEAVVERSRRKYRDAVLHLPDAAYLSDQLTDFGRLVLVGDRPKEGHDAVIDSTLDIVENPIEGVARVTV